MLSPRGSRASRLVEKICDEARTIRARGASGERASAITGDSLWLEEAFERFELFELFRLLEEENLCREGIMT
jgi:hypothetical protein